MPGELNKEKVEQVQNICREQGIVPVSNLPNEDLRLTELKDWTLWIRTWEGILAIHP